MMGCVSLPRRPWFVFILFGLLVFASRWPWAPGQLFTFDDVNLAYSIGHFDVRISQPHPPGYPLFVMEMRVLHWLRFRRAESILLALALTGSLAALLLMVWCGNRILGADSGYYAAWLTVFHPVFWHAGVTSALRVQLAVVSLAAATACWRAWQADARWVLWSALVVGFGAGIRPETGPLFPLWAACALRAPVSWKSRATALSAMAAAVLVWLLPAMLASGGPRQYVTASLNYISDQASVTSGLFGATDNTWLTTFWRLLVWIFCGLLSVTLPAVLAWRRRSGTEQSEAWGLGWSRTVFLGIWFLPAFLFAISIHVEDPGQTLALVPVVSLFGGYLINRAVANLTSTVSVWHALSFALLPPLVLWMVDFRDIEFVVVWAPVASLGVPLILRWGERAISRALALITRLTIRWYALPLAVVPFAVLWFSDRRHPVFILVWLLVVFLAAGLFLTLAKNLGPPPASHVSAVLLAPVVLLNCTLFYHQWYYQAPGAAGSQAIGDRVLADLASGLALTSLDHIKSTLAVDDHTLRQMIRLAAERPGHAVVVWEHGLAAWRKAAYYAPGLPIVVLEHKKIRAGSPPVIAVWKGAKMEQRLQGLAPSNVTGPAPLRLTLPAGTERIVWLLNPRTPFYDLVQRSFAPAAAPPVYYTDLPRESGSRTLGEYEIAW
jgi:hypothetical protein